VARIDRLKKSPPNAKPEWGAEHAQRWRQSQGITREPRPLPIVDEHTWSTDRRLDGGYERLRQIGDLFFHEDCEYLGESEDHAPFKCKATPQTLEQAVAWLLSHEYEDDAREIASKAEKAERDAAIGEQPAPEEKKTADESSGQPPKPTAKSTLTPTVGTHPPEGEDALQDNVALGATEVAAGGATRSFEPSELPQREKDILKALLLLKALGRNRSVTREKAVRKVDPACRPASYNKAVARLKRRGLIDTCKRVGIWLLPAGKAAGEAL
jgi:hypothetical protein